MKVGKIKERSMSKSNTRRTKLRGRRGCLIWLPFLLFALVAGAIFIIYPDAIPKPPNLPP